MEIEIRKDDSKSVRLDFENKYTQLIHNLPAAIYTCDANGYIRLYNQAAVDLWGREPVIGQDLWCGSWKIFSPEGDALPLDECPMAIALKEGRAVNDVEIVVERPDGVRRSVLPHPRPIFNGAGKVIEAVNMLVDITDQKNRERVERERLETIVNKRTKELQKLNAELVRSNQGLEEYAYVASHDLQEPIRKIQIFTNLIQQRHGQVLPEDVRCTIGKIESAATRMSRLVKDLLSFSRLSQNGYHHTFTDLNDVLARVKSDLELAIKEKNAKIIHERLPVILAAPVQIDQLFYNIIGNSLKFAADSRDPLVRITSRELSHEEVTRHAELDPADRYHHISISDNGIGFSQLYADQIFVIFKRLAERASEGSGIGLALCKKIVQNHHGKIFAVGRENEGATFHIILPENHADH